MASQKSIVIRHKFGGGWATDLGPSVDVSQSQDGKVVIPFLVDAENCLFELDGGPRKIGGTTKVNSSAVSSGAVVTGVYDYWRLGTAGSPTRRRILHAGVNCYADTDDGVFTTALDTGLESGKVPSYCTFDDLLIFSSDSTIDVPRSWDQTTVQALAGTPPRFPSAWPTRTGLGRRVFMPSPRDCTTRPIPTRKTGPDLDQGPSTSIPRTGT